MDCPLVKASAEIEHSFVAPCWREYVSVFRIDGIPILPPLMTAEKREEMRELKEKAIEIERKLLEHKERFSFENSQSRQRRPRIPCKKVDSRCCSNNNTHRFELQTNDRSIQERAKDASYTVLYNRKQETGNIDEVETKLDVINISSGSTLSNLATQESDFKFLNRIQKLEKDDTLIFDNNADDSNVAAESDVEYERHEKEEKLEKILMKTFGELNLLDVERNANLNYINTDVMANFSTDVNVNQIPLICVNPPTPVVENSNFCAVPTMDNESVYSLEVEDQRQLSTDESDNCSQIDPEKNSQTSEKSSNIANRILHFEDFTNNTNSNTTQYIVSAPQRSATSPSLKGVQMHSSKKTLEVNSPETETNLLRSNSFTLERPSKALIEHMRAQKLNNKSRRSAPASSATRDTVESKAKRVQKIDQKSHLYKIYAPSVQLKTPANKTKTSTSNQVTNSTKVYRSSLSPYETKSSTKSKLKSYKKSISTVITPKQIPKTKNISASKGTSSKSNAVSEFESEQRQKFLELIELQREEQRRLEKTFEEQQRLLLEQFARKMSNIHLQQQSAINTERNIKIHTDIQPSMESSPHTHSESSEQFVKSPTSSSISSSIFSSITGSATNTPKTDKGSLSESSSTLTTATINSNYASRRRLFSVEQPAGAAPIGDVIQNKSNSYSVSLGGKRPIY